MRNFLSFAIVIASFFFSTTAFAELGTFRKSTISCGQGTTAYDCLLSSTKDGTLASKLNCTPEFLFSQMAYAFNQQTGYGVTGEQVKQGLLDGQFYVATKVKASRLMNSRLAAADRAEFYKLSGNAEIQVLATKDMSGREIYVLKLQGTNNVNACFNPCYAVDIKPIPPAKKQEPITDVPHPSNPMQPYDLPQAQPMQQPQQIVVYQQQEVLLTFPEEKTPFIMPVVAFAPIAVVQPAPIFINNGCRNCGQQNPPKDSVGHTPHGKPYEGDPYVGPQANPNGGPIVGNPGGNYWGNGTTTTGNTGNGGPNEGNPGGNTTTNDNSGYWGNNFNNNGSGGVAHD